MKKVIVTGASGFIGRHSLRPLLERGYKIHALSRNLPEFKQKNIIWHQVDLFDYLAIKRIMREISPSHLLHFAWYTEHQKFWASLDNIHWISASVELLSSFIDSGGKRFVFAGTCAEYNENRAICKENQRNFSPQGLYGECKAALQKICERIAIQNKKSYSWGRIFFTFGPYENRNRFIPQMISLALQNKELKCQDGNLIRDFLYVEDLANAFVALLDSNIEGIVNIASGKKMQMQNILLLIASLMERKDLYLPEKDNRLGKTQIADIYRLKNEVKWKPSISLEDALLKTIRWWEDEIYRRCSK